MKLIPDRFIAYRSKYSSKSIKYDYSELFLFVKEMKTKGKKEGQIIYELERIGFSEELYLYYEKLMKEPDLREALRNWVYSIGTFQPTIRKVRPDLIPELDNYFPIRWELEESGAKPDKVILPKSDKAIRKRKPMSDETKRKMRKPRSKEGRKNICEGQRLRRERERLAKGE